MSPKVVLALALFVAVAASSITDQQFHDKFLELYKHHVETGLLKFPVGERAHVVHELVRYLRGEITKPDFIEPIADKYVHFLTPSQKSELADFTEHLDLSTLPETQFTEHRQPHGVRLAVHDELHNLIIGSVTDQQFHDKFFDLYKHHLRTGLLKFPVSERAHAVEELVKYFHGTIVKPDFIEPIADQYIQFLTRSQKNELAGYAEQLDLSTLPETQITEHGSPHGAKHAAHEDLHNLIVGSISDHQWHDKFFGLYKYHAKTGLVKFPVSERADAAEQLVKYLRGQIDMPDFIEPVADKYIQFLTQSQKNELANFVEHFELSSLPETQFTESGSPHAIKYHDIDYLHNHIEGTLTDEQFHDRFFDVYKQHIKTGLVKFPVAERAHAQEELVKYLRKETPKPDFIVPVADRYIQFLTQGQKNELSNFAEHLDLSTLPQTQFIKSGSPHGVKHVVDHDLYTIVIGGMSNQQFHEKFFDFYKHHVETGLLKFPVEERAHAAEELVKYLRGHIDMPDFIEPIADRYIEYLSQGQKNELADFAEHLDLSTLPETQFTEDGSPHGDRHAAHDELHIHIEGSLTDQQFHDKFFDLYKYHVKTGLQKFPVGERAHGVEELVKYLKGLTPKPDFIEPIADRYIHFLTQTQRNELSDFAEHLDLSTLPEAQLTEDGSPHTDPHAAHDELHELIVGSLTDQQFRDKFCDLYKYYIRTGALKFSVGERAHALEQLVKYFHGEIAKPDFVVPIADHYIQFLTQSQKNKLANYAEHLDLSTLPQTQFTESGSPHDTRHHALDELHNLIVGSLTDQQFHGKFFDLYKYHVKTGLIKFPAAERAHALDELAKYLHGQTAKPDFIVPIADRYIHFLTQSQRNELAIYAEHLDLSTLPETHFDGSGSPHGIRHNAHDELHSLIIGSITDEQFHDKYFSLYKHHCKTGLLKFPVDERAHAVEEFVKYLHGTIAKPDFIEPIADKYIQYLTQSQKNELADFGEHLDLSTLPSTQFTDPGSPHGEKHVAHDELQSLVEAH